MIGQDLWEHQENETYRVNIMGQELIRDHEDETYRVNIVGQEMFSDQLKMMDGVQRKVMSQDSQEVAVMAGHQVALQEEPLLFMKDQAGRRAVLLSSRWTSRTRRAWRRHCPRGPGSEFEEVIGTC